MIVLVMLSTFAKSTIAFLIHSAVLSAIGLFAFMIMKSGHRRPLGTYAEIPLMILIAWFYVTIVRLNEPTVPLTYFAQIFIPTFALLLAIAKTRKPLWLFSAMMAVLTAAGTIHSFLAIVGYWFGDRTVEAQRWLRIEVGPFDYSQAYFLGDRLSGITHNPNTLGIWIFLAGSALVYLKQRNLLKWPLFIVLMLLNGYGLIMTQSRAAIMAFLIVLVGVAAVEWWNNRKKDRQNKRKGLLIGAVSLLIVGAGALTFSDTVRERIESGLNGRERIWSAILRLVAEHPLDGFGFGTAFRVLSDAGVVKSPHNLYLRLQLETGIIGTLIFAVFLLSLCYLLFWRIKTSGDPKLYSFIAVFILAILAHQNFEDLVFKSHVMHLLFFVLVAFAVRSFSEKEANDDPTGKH